LKLENKIQLIIEEQNEIDKISDLTNKNKSYLTESQIIERKKTYSKENKDKTSEWGKKMVYQKSRAIKGKIGMSYM
jgi:hypothetical protein